MNALCSSSVWLGIVSFALGACICSFLNVYAHRMPKLLEREWLSDFQDWLAERSVESPAPVAEALAAPKETLSSPGSRCPSCGTPIPPWANIPVLGWLLLRGRAHCCGLPISWRYPFWEFFGGLMFFLAVWAQPCGMKVVFSCVVLTFLFAAAMIDFESMLLPDGLTHSFIGVALLGAVAEWGSVDASASIVGLLAGFLLLQAVRVGGRVVFRREAMGGGDPPLLAAIGAVCGLEALPSVLLVAALSAIGYWGFLKLSGRNGSAPIPFGPFLALGAAAWQASQWGLLF